MSLPIDFLNDTPEKRRARAEATVASLKAKGIGGGRLDWTVDGNGGVIAPNGPGVEVYEQLKKKGNPYFNDPVNQSYFKKDSDSNGLNLLNNHLQPIMNMPGFPTIGSPGTTVRAFNSPESAQAHMKAVMTGKIDPLAEDFNMTNGIVSPQFEEFLRTKARRVG